MTHSNPARHRVALVLCAMACFATMDTLAKFASATVPVVVAIWVRFMVQTAVAGAAVLPARGAAVFRTNHPRLQFLRGACTSVSSALGLLSLKTLAVADFTAVIMLIPMVITAVSSTHLKERVPVVRWLLLLGGLAGALIVIRPGASGVQWGTLAALGCVAFNSAFQLLTSHLAKDDDPQGMNFYTGAVAAAIFTVALPFFGEFPSFLTGALLMFIGLCNTVGQYLMIVAYSRARPGVLTRYLYFQIPFAAFAGWCVFSKAPDRWALAGIAIITLCGLASADESKRACKRWVDMAIRTMAARRSP
jgi:drug/metabolite transporter (DMT)-like permease